MSESLKRFLLNGPLISVEMILLHQMSVIASREQKYKIDQEKFSTGILTFQPVSKGGKNKHIFSKLSIFLNLA